MTTVTNSIQREIQINASATKIYDAIANPKQVVRWVPGANQYLGDVTQVKSTLVEFRIIEQANGSCTLSLTESGFADLPEDVIEASFQQNSNGWDFMLGRLAALVGMLS